MSSQEKEDRTFIAYALLLAAAEARESAVIRSLGVPVKAVKEKQKIYVRYAALAVDSFEEQYAEITERKADGSAPTPGAGTEQLAGGSQSKAK